MNLITAFENHSQWSAVKEVSARLRDAGYEALLAGGSVRDVIMGRTPNDFDIATSATPDDVEKLFPNAVMVGKAFGVAIIPFKDFQIEVATFREDLEYKDGRRPEGVKFSTPSVDAKRRDFTVNALFLDPRDGKVIDFVGGEKDIQKKILRTVGDPNRRFDEDKLRLLRAVRFAAQLGFDIDPETLSAVTARASEVSVVSHERIRDELLKLLKTKSQIPRGLRLLIQTGLLSGSFPESAPSLLDNEDLWIKRFEVLEGNEPLETLLALFFEPAFQQTGEKDFRDRHLKSLKFDNQTIEQIFFILRHVKEIVEPDRMRRGELIQLSFHPMFERTIEAAKAIALANGDSIDWIQRLRELTQVQAKAPQYYLTGEELKKAGFLPGPDFGLILKESQLLQLEGVLQSREQALDWLSSRRREG